MVNIEGILTALKEKVISFLLFEAPFIVVFLKLSLKTRHKIAVDRFGQASGRIIELLSKSKYLEQQAISDMILVPAREARERLYRLYRSERLTIHFLRF